PILEDGDGEAAAGHRAVDDNDLPITDAVAGVELIVEDAQGAAERVVRVVVGKGTRRLQTGAAVEAVRNHGTQLAERFFLQAGIVNPCERYLALGVDFNA